MKRTPIEVFSDWAKDGRDEGMENNHAVAVENMLNLSINSTRNFSFIDAGCGNGWVVRKTAALPNCQNAIGVDGSAEMIAKAKKIDPDNHYHCEDLMVWKPQNKVDLVHSMEVFYYLQNPQQLLEHIASHWLKDKARLIIGLDYYQENKVSHSWSQDCGIANMQLFSEKTWSSFFINAGFKEVKSWRVDAKENWAGTLVITGVK